MTDVHANDPTAVFLRDMASLGEEAAWQAHAEAGPAVESVVDAVVPVPGTDGLRARVYYPTHTASEPKPALHLHLYGGGWCQGSVDSWIVDAQCRERATFGDAVVVSVDYRKAPAHPFPTAIEDSYAALEWVADRAAEFGASGRLTVSGVSAGANIAAAVVMLAAERGGPRVHHQILEALPADLRTDEPTFWHGPDLTGMARRDLATGVGWYLPNSLDAESPLASPIVATDLAGLPPTSILIGDRDPLYAGAVAFARNLAAAGVETHLREFAGFVHHTPALTRTVPEARGWRSLVGDAIAGRGVS